MAALALAAACQGATAGEGPRCDAFVGERGAPPEARVIFRAPENGWVVAEAAGPAPLLQASQGGFVMLTSAEGKNLAGCDVKVVTSFLDPFDGGVLISATRTIQLTTGPDGWGGPPERTYDDNFNHLGICPGAGQPRDLQGVEYRVAVTLTDPAGRTAHAELPVVPGCSQPDRAAVCRCQCAPDYQLGSKCPAADGG
ncbi:MAG: hypothetical protein IPJ65_25970 [Archangiaceae bacterium]|nr:hypothetical protein [Archangiaceae bacterium]